MDFEKFNSQPTRDRSEKQEIPPTTENPTIESQEKAVSFSMEEIEKLGNMAKKFNEKIEEANNELKEIFPNFRETIESLKNNNADFKVNEVFAKKFEALSARCNSIIDKFIRLSGNKKLFVNQIGILTIIERHSKFFTESKGKSSVADAEKMEEIGDKLLENMEVLEQLVQNL